MLILEVRNAPGLGNDYSGLKQGLEKKHLFFFEFTMHYSRRQRLF